ncbi:glycosyltransferase family 2 protein [Segetibacter sp. 3557_3]|uniref:glycosyltransferase family 2 protein n=1 Tax=Segetibacter sp. 3557_3 TaxID=2547429 RepID=UPI001058693E|nr:glycosyltransferase family 2 protein [Segetibacter sp. 3557_3]TDH28078.1 glycosyltransferase family 2 protein [Segetibacter sp. 3557_3]
MQTYPSVAIVILNYNTRHYLEQFLPFVLASDYPDKQVVVADNASTDDSVSWVRSHFPGVKVLVNDRNYGFAEGYNQALRQVKADYYVLLNSDVEVTSDWIMPVIAMFEADEKLAACQPKLLSYHNRHLFEYAGAAGGWIDALGYPFSMGRVFEICETDNGQYDTASRIFWASGAAMFVRAKVYHELNGLDPYFFAHQEEIDLCWRMQLAGYAIKSCPQSIVYHVGGGTLPQSDRKVFLNFRNNLVMVTKNWPPTMLWWKLPLRIVLDVVSAMQALLAGKRGFARAVVQAHFAFYKWLFSTKRENLFSRGRNGKIHGVFSGSIVWAYFIKNKKTFNEIVQ